VSDERPLGFVYNWVPDYRRGLLELLARRQGARYLLFGGRTLHPQDLGEQLAGLDAPVEAVRQREVGRALAAMRPRAVVASTNGRVALPAAYLAARRLGVPFVLWATIWRHPRTAAHALSWLPMRWIYAHADAVVTYGPHVSAYVARFRDGRAVFEAPQALDNEVFGAPPDAAALAAVAERTGGEPFVLFAGRLVRAKGVRVLAEAWRRLAAGGGGEPGARLAVAGEGPLSSALAGLPGVVRLGHLRHEELRPWYAAARALVLPSVPTRPFVEPWGYVVNEAFLQGTPAIVSDAVGAAAGGLAREGRNALVVPAGDPAALAAAIRRLLDDPALAERLGAAGRSDVAPYTHQAQAAGFELALADLGVARGC